jgi:hypothetical protein
MLPDYASTIVCLDPYDLVDVFGKVAVPVPRGLVLHVIQHFAEPRFGLLGLNEPFHHVLNVHYHGASFELPAESPLYGNCGLAHLFVDLLLPSPAQLLSHPRYPFLLLLDDLLEKQVPVETLEATLILQEGSQTGAFQRAQRTVLIHRDEMRGERGVSVLR